MSKRLVLSLVLAAVAAGLLVEPAERGAARSGPYVWLYCISIGHQRLECQYEVTGGTGVYTNVWKPVPYAGGSGSSGTALVRCARAYSYQTVTLTATDSSGATGSQSYTAYCGDAL